MSGLAACPLGWGRAREQAHPGRPGRALKAAFWSPGAWGISWGLLGISGAISSILDLSHLQSARPTPSSSTSSSRPASLGYSGAAGPRPITQSELATALALASTPESSSHTPTPGTQVWSSLGCHEWAPEQEWIGLCWPWGIPLCGSGHSRCVWGVG